MSLDGAFAHAGQVLHDLLGPFASEKSGHRDERDEEKNEEAGALDLFAPAPEAVEQEGGSQRDADDGNVIEDDMEVCGIHAPNQATVVTESGKALRARGRPNLVTGLLPAA